MFYISYVYLLDDFLHVMALAVIAYLSVYLKSSRKWLGYTKAVMLKVQIIKENVDVDELPT